MSIFKNAKTLDAKPTGKAKAEKREIAVAGIQTLAEIEALLKSLEAAKTTLAAEIKEAGFGEFLALETNVRPESFKGVDGQATCSVEMRKRGTNSALNQDEVEILEKLGLKPFKEVVAPELFGINPVYASDEALMNKVSKALEKIVPSDFIVHQEERSKLVVNDELLEAAFRLPYGSEERKTALALVTTMALKPKLNADYDMSKLVTNVTTMLGLTEPETRQKTVEEQEAEGVELISAQPAVKRARKTKATAE